MSEQQRLVYNTAVADFRRARKKAAIQQLMSRLTGKQNELLAYDDVCRQLGVEGIVKQGQAEIPLEAIIGSVGRYKDFTRDFLPKKDSDEERWAQVRKAVTDMTGLPPIDVYKVGEVYFVIDGNHRVSVARDLGTKTITAYVTEVKTRVPLTPDDDFNELICKAQYAEFLKKTNLDVIRPEADLFMTFCGHFRIFEAQIDAHRRVIEEAAGETIPYETAVSRWYDDVYLPVIQLIRQRGAMRSFPQRTEADIYILLSWKREEVEASLGWEVDSAETIEALTAEQIQPPQGVAGRILGGIWRAGLVDDGPEPGHWREFQVSRQADRLFADYLVLIEGKESDWHMLSEVIGIAQREGDRLLGLHVVSQEADMKRQATLALGERFTAFCAEAGVRAEFAVENGDVVACVIEASVWADLVIMGLNQRPGDGRVARLGHRISQIVQRIPRPILLVPSGAACRMEHILLAYDGSPKADEALYVAAYLTERWQPSLTVLTVVTENTPADALDKASRYLAQQGIDDVNLVLREKPIAGALMETAATYNSDYLIIGGFGFRPFKHLVLGSTVDHVLRHFRHPILICR